MKKYFLHNDFSQSGPFDLDELPDQNLTRNTAVWHPENKRWVSAWKMKELNAYFETGVSYSELDGMSLVMPDEIRNRVYRNILSVIILSLVALVCILVLL